MTSPPLLFFLPMLLRLFIINQQLAILSVPPRFLPRVLHHTKNILRLLEDTIHFLQTPIRSFGIEEVDNRDNKSVNDCEDDVGLVFDVVECYRGNHDHHEIKEPVA